MVAVALMLLLTTLAHGCSLNTTTPIMASGVAVVDSGAPPYEASMTCTWSVGSPLPPSPFAAVHAVTFDTECGWDYVFIHAGPGPEYPLVAALSGALTVAPHSRPDPLSPPSLSWNAAFPWPIAMVETSLASPTSAAGPPTPTWIASSHPAPLPTPPPPPPLPPPSPPAAALYVQFTSDSFKVASGFTLAVSALTCPYNCSGVGVCSAASRQCVCPPSRSGHGCERSASPASPLLGPDDVAAPSAPYKWSAGPWDEIDPSGVCVCEPDFAPTYPEWMRSVRGGSIKVLLRGPPGSDCGVASCSGLAPCPVCSPNATRLTEAGAPDWSSCADNGAPCVRYLVQSCGSDAPGSGSGLAMYILPIIVLVLGWGWACFLYPVYSYWHRSSARVSPPDGDDDLFAHAFHPDDVAHHIVLLPIATTASASASTAATAPAPSPAPAMSPRPLPHLIPHAWGGHPDRYVAVFAHPPHPTPTAPPTATPIPLLSLGVLLSTQEAMEGRVAPPPTTPRPVTIPPALQ